MVILILSDESSSVMVVFIFLDDIMGGAIHQIIVGGWSAIDSYRTDLQNGFLGRAILESKERILNIEWHPSDVFLLLEFRGPLSNTMASGSSSPLVAPLPPPLSKTTSGEGLPLTSWTCSVCTASNASFWKVNTYRVVYIDPGNAKWVHRLGSRHCCQNFQLPRVAA